MLCAVAGASLVALRPPMPWKGEIGFWYDAEHVPDASRDDVGVYGERVGAKNRGWPAWLLIASILAGLFVASAPGAAGRHPGVGRRASAVLAPPTRFALSASGGAAYGAYLATEYFPGADATLVACLTAACASSAVGLAFTYAPCASSPTYVPWIFAAAGACLFAAHASQSAAGARAGDDWARREDARAGVLGASAGMSLQVAFAVKIKADGVRGDRGMEGFEGFDTASAAARLSNPALRRSRRFRGVVAHLVGSASELARRALVNARAGWMPAVGNVATSVAFVASIATAIRIRPESNLHALALAPILLLLHEDGVVFESLAGRKKYAPPLVAATVVLLAAAATEIARGAPSAAMATGATTRALGMNTASAWTAKNAAATAATAPCAWRLATYLWRSERTSTVTILALAPINALVIVAADVGAARVLAWTSVACAVGLFVAQRRARAAGMRAL